MLTDHVAHGGSTARLLGALAWAAVFLLAVAGYAEAQPAEVPPRATTLEPPEPIDARIEYPAGADEVAEVVLEIEVDREGTVTSARVVEGKAPFDEAALSAAQRWRFRPAMQGGKPVLARIRYTVRFEPPLKAEKAEEPVPTIVPTAPAPSAPLEVIVRGERLEPPPLGAGTVSLSREQASEIPGTFGDPMRAVEAQPGVVPLVSGLPSFFVRGAPPANVGYYIDGIEVPLLYHAFFGPSVLHPGLIERVTLYGGAPPVEFGRFAGPAVSADVAPLNRRLTGEATVRLVDAGLLAEAPFGGCEGPVVAGCSRGSVRLGGRYSYTGLILSQLGDAELDYWDYQGHAGYMLGKHDEISLLSFGAYDHFEAGGTGQQGGGEVTFHRVDLRWDHQTDATAIRVGATYGFDQTGGVEEQTSLVRDNSLRLRGTIATKASSWVTFKAGLDGRIDDYDLETDPLLLNFADYSELFPDRTEYSAGAFMSVELEPVRGIRVVPGVRTDIYYDRGATRVGVDPRVVAEFAVSRRVTLEQSLGVAHQRPNFVPQVPGAQVADLEGGLQEALLYSSGVRVRMPAAVDGSATVFNNGYFNALDPLSRRRDFTIDRTVLDTRMTIRSWGLEFKVERPIVKGLGGFVAYTLSHTELSDGRDESVTGFDRPHVLQVALGYDFGNRFTIGARSVFYSGVPEMNLEGEPHFTDNRRGKPYFRVDLRARKRFRLGESGYWGLTAEVLNATYTRESVRLHCGERCVERYAGPVVLPSLGIEAGL